MEAQNHNPEGGPGKHLSAEGETQRTQRSKFPEPRAWALNWETMHREQATGQANGRFNLELQSKPGSGRWDKFPQPRGWALQWDGHSIDAQQTTMNGEPWTPEDERNEDEK